VARADSVDEEAKVIVDLRAEPARPVVKLPTAPERPTGVWVVVLAYVIAATALALAIYERFLA
jgi:hypothetical protein